MSTILLKLLALPIDQVEWEQTWHHLLRNTFGELQKVVQHNHALDWNACFQLLEDGKLIISLTYLMPKRIVLYITWRHSDV